MIFLRAKMASRLPSIQRAIMGAVTSNRRAVCTTSIQAQSFHSLNETSYFHPQDNFMTDEENPASGFGYRVVVSRPRRLSSTVTSSTTRYNDTYNDDFAAYSPLHDNIVDPKSLDILSSPEVLEILESQREWDNSARDSSRLSASSSSNSKDTVAAAASTAAEKDDEYLSDCEEMDESWEDVETNVTSWEEDESAALESRPM